MRLIRINFHQLHQLRQLSSAPSAPSAPSASSASSASSAPIFSIYSTSSDGIKLSILKNISLRRKRSIVENAPEEYHKSLHDKFYRKVHRKFRWKDLKSGSSVNKVSSQLLWNLNHWYQVTLILYCT
ncbi:unnamed protein product [Rhizophagus irregularis]|nr:unnamed protein product [Rhizophagus irregularis]CAB4426472.1 unnamed protein product [Rhizophagus irregularis]